MRHIALKQGCLGTMLIIATLLTGCAVERVKVGTPRDQVTATYGEPSAVVPLPAGQRLQYSRQPAGQSAVMVDLDANGLVSSVRQVLNPADFSRVVVGKWTRADALAEFGRPASVDRVASWPGDILTYRWRDVNVPMQFYVYLDAAQIVQRTGVGMEYRRNDRR